MQYMSLIVSCFIFFFFNDTATTEIYTLSLHDALPICIAHVETDAVVAHVVDAVRALAQCAHFDAGRIAAGAEFEGIDRKSTRLNSSHSQISYAVFCLKKKKNLNHRPDIAYDAAYAQRH